MALSDIKSRLNNLYSLREKLCDKQKKEMEIEEITNWIVGQLNYLKVLINNKNVDRSEIRIRIDDIICALDVEEDDNE
jgi:short-subunit dehydrogenase involved in D-alanine esterification of teichoic acids